MGNLVRDRRCNDQWSVVYYGSNNEFGFKRSIEADSRVYIQPYYGPDKYAYWGSNHTARYYGRVFVNDGLRGYILEDATGFPWVFVEELRIVKS